MRRTLRTAATLATATVVAAAVAVPLTASPALAVSLGQGWSIADSDGDGAYGLFQVDLSNGASTVVDESAAYDLSDLSSSTDGTRVAYVKNTSTRQQIVVRDISKQVVRTVLDLPKGGSTFAFEPQLSPDGTTLVWTQVTFGTSVAVSVHKANVGAGAASTILSGYGALGFLDASTLLVQNSAGANKYVPLAGGTPLPVTGLPTYAQQVSVSPVGNRIVWSEDTTPLTGTVSTADVKGGTLVNTSGAWSVTSPVTISTTLDNEQPAFSRDGDTVYWVQYDGDAGPGNVLSRPYNLATPPAALTSTASDEFDVAITNAAATDTSAPADATATAATLAGTSAVLHWTLPTDGDLSGVILSRSGKTAYVPAPLTSYVDSGLVLGTTYAYTFKAVDRSGNQATGVTRSLTALAAATTVGVPTSRNSTKVSFGVRFATVAPAGTTFTADYLPYGSTSFKPWVTGAEGAVRTFGAPASGNVNATTAVIGGSYRFRARVSDAFGNTSGWSVSVPTVVPYDQSKATLYGGTTVASGGAYLGSVRRFTSTSSYAKVTLVGRTLYVVGLRCSSCGSFAIYEGTTKLATVSTYSSSTVYRSVLFSKAYTANGTHTYTLRPLGTAGHPAVALDAWGMLRQ